MTGQLGSIMGSNVYDDPPRYIKGNMVCAGGLFANVILAIAGIYYLKRCNQKKDEIYGAADHHAVMNGASEEEIVRHWRYVM